MITLIFLLNVDLSSKLLLLLVQGFSFLFPGFFKLFVIIICFVRIPNQKERKQKQLSKKIGLYCHYLK